MGPFEFPAWDPVLLDLPGPLDIRWYGLMYVLGFIVGQWILTRLAKAKVLPIEPNKVADMIFYLVFGVILGGRFGYAIFYDQGLVNPLKLVQIWQGGLSFHGGLIGVIVAMMLFARKQKVPFWRVGDACAIAVTPGIFFVRMANFINGELYGRVTTADTFGAMRFPTDPIAQDLLGLRTITDKRDQELCVQYAHRRVEWEDIEGSLSTHDAAGREIPWDQLRERLDWEAIVEQVPYRHPSQVYEGIGEGLLVGLILLIIYLRTRARPLGAGAYSGVFLIAYGVVRFFIEFLRQPDRQFATAEDPLGRPFLGMTMGQALCAGMILFGVYMIRRSRGRRTA